MTPWTAARQASLSITNSWSLLKLMSIKSVMPSNHLILCRPLLLLPSIFPSIRVFSNDSALHIRWPKYWSFSFSISPSNEYSGLISFRMDWSDPFPPFSAFPPPVFVCVNVCVCVCVCVSMCMCVCVVNQNQRLPCCPLQKGSLFPYCLEFLPSRQALLEAARLAPRWVLNSHFGVY